MLITFRQMIATLVLAIFTFTATDASAQLVRHRFGVPGVPGPGGFITLPYTFSDAAGNLWRVYSGGWIQQQGNQPVYSQGSVLTINGAQPNQANNQGRVDEKTNELILENITIGNVTVTRRISFDKERDLVRCIDVFHNPQNAEQTIAVSIQSNFNFGINASQFVSDTRKKDQNVAWIGQTGSGESAVEMFAGKGAKLVPALSSPQGNNFLQATISLTIAAGKDSAIMHLHKIVPSQDAGSGFVTNLKETALLKSIPGPLRRLIVNFPNGQGWIGDIELLRGDLLDVVELRGGDQARGTLQEPVFALQTLYGPVSLAGDRVLGIVNMGQFRPRQLIVTVDGQIFGGRLKKETLDLKLSSGQITQIPLAQMTRVGFKKRGNEPDEWTFETPLAMLRTGERMAIKPLQIPIDLATRYGKLAIPAAAVAAISFQNDDNGVHEIQLSDGSKFAGLAGTGEFDVTLETTGQTIKLPTSSIARLQFAPKLPEIDDLSPTLRLLNDDILVGTVGGKLNLETAFDTIVVNASEIRGMTRAKDSVQDVQIVLWDGTSLSGQLDQSELDCQLKCGVAMKLPVAMLQDYSQPQPVPSASMLEKIKAFIADLNSDDWKVRDRSSAALVGMGPVAESALKELRANQPPEAQKAIDIVVQKLEDQRKKEKPASASPTTSNNAPAQGF